MRQEHAMPDMDETKGKVKEAAGDLTDDDRLKREGKADQAKGKVKEGIDRVTEAVKDLTK
jgi:uncharacterized protein YjbJ (UPF0337 family)